jgi:hypothetical protein
MEIYVLIDDKAQGPYTRELVRQYLNSGQLKPTDLAAYAGRADWKPLSAMVQSWGGAPPQKASPSSPGQTTKRKPIAAIIAGGVLLLLLAGAAVWMLHRKTAGHVARIDQSKLPKSLAELNAWYAEPPEGQNAATYFLRGFEAIQIAQADLKSSDLPIIGKGAMPPLGEPLPSRARMAMDAFVQKNQAAWTALQEGAAFEQARYPIDTTLGSGTLLPHLAKIKKAAQCGQLRTMMYADNKQPQEAADSMLLSLAQAQSLKDEPILISQLVRVACIAIDTASLEYTLNSVALSPADLERLSTAFAKVESEDSDGSPFTRGMIAERVFSQAFFDLPPDKMEQEIKNFDPANQPNVPADQLAQNLPSQRAFVEKTFDRAFEMRQELMPERLKVDDYMSSRASEAKDKQYYLCELRLSGLGGAAKREARGLSMLRLAQAAIALERYHQEKGSYPDSLAALVPKFLPAVPVDPANGKEMHYEKSGEGYEATSTGINAPKPQSIKVIKPPKLSL